MLSAAIHNREIEKRTAGGKAESVPLTDDEVLLVIRSELKKRRDAALAYDTGNRPDAASRERAEAEMLSALLPAELSDAELGALVAEGIKATGASTARDFGKLMGWVMGRAQGRTSGERVSLLIKEKIGSS